MHYNRFLPLITPLVSFFLLEIIVISSQALFVVLVLLILLYAFTVRQFTMASKLHKEWWNYLILPAVFSVSSVIFFTLLASTLLIHLILIINLVFTYFYFRALYSYLLRQTNYKKYSLENLSSYGNFLAIYFFSSSIYGLEAFLGISVWPLMVIFVVVIALVSYQVMITNRIVLKIGIFYILIASLVLVEIAWTASFLTLNHYVLGLIVAVCYYVLIGLIRFYLLGLLDKRMVKQYLIFGIGSILIVLFTARWV